MANRIPIPTESEMAAAEERALHYQDPTCLSYWFPKLLAAGLPVPKTRIVTIPTQSIRSGLFRTLDAKPFDGPTETWLVVLKLAAEEIGFPCFLRTGQTSGKHEWRDTCYVESADKLLSHVVALIEYSECAALAGLDWNVWALRELLPTKPMATVYRGMPLCREFRCFVDEGKLQCCHPYWPKDAVRNGFGGDIPEDFAEMYAELSILTAADYVNIKSLAIQAGIAVPGSWSVDMLETERGWYVTDLALAKQSWHWPGCIHNQK